MLSPEATPNQPALLPLPPEVHFEHGFNYQLADLVWRNEAYSHTADALETLVESLNHQETLDLAYRIDEMELEDSLQRSVLPLVHGEPREITVDEFGIIRAIVNDTRNLKNTIFNYVETRLGEVEDETLIIDALLADFTSDLRAAAQHLNGAEYATAFIAVFENVLEHRQNKTNTLDNADFEIPALFDV